jgi:hypothetical protein
LVGALVVWAAGVSIATASPISLLLPQGTAFSFLGHSCGGIQEQAFATGFDPVTGYPIGEVYIQTRCGGSGRGGGYHTTTYSAWVGVTWDFTGTVISAAKLTTAPVVSGTFHATDAYGDQVYNTGVAAYLVVPAPTAPIDVTATQVGDQFDVSWVPTGVNPEAIESSTITATPSDPTAPTLTATVSGAATSGFVGSLEPQTTYEITVVVTTIGGPSPASAPYAITTGAASLPPSAPTGVTARWGGQGATTANLIASWNAAVPGDSPIDAYEVMIKGSDGGGTFTQEVPGTTLTAIFNVDFIPDWTVTVSAHNAVGWGPWSAPARLGGL